MYYQRKYRKIYIKFQSAKDTKVILKGGIIMNNNQYLKEGSFVNEVDNIIVGVSTIYSTYSLQDAMGDNGDWED